MNTQDSNGNDVFGPSAASLLMYSAISVEAMMRGQWSDPRGTAFIIKRVSAWSEAFAQDIIPDMVKGHELASFEKKALDNVGDYGQGRINLHISLLLHASKEMIMFCENGVGRNTAEHVRTWFTTLMERTMESELFSRASKKLRAELRKVCKNFNEIEVNISGIERPFFHPPLLFIRVALLVWFFTKGDNGTFAIPPVEESQHLFLLVDRGDMEEWEHLSGILVSSLLQARSHGLDLVTDDRADNAKPSFFQVIYLPYQSVQWRLKLDRSKVKVPSVMVAHNEVIDNLLEFVHDDVSALDIMTEWEQGEVLKWEHLSEKASEANKNKVKNSIKGREKYSRHYYKGREFKNPKHPEKFLRNTFLLGKYSFHHIFVANATPWARSGARAGARTGPSNTTASLRCASLSPRKRKFPTIVENCDRGWKFSSHKLENEKKNLGRGGKEQWVKQGLLSKYQT